jgi:hypothetical protein
MKFLALLKKELRECLPCLLLAFVVFTFFGVIILRVNIHYYGYGRWSEEPGRVISGRAFLQFNPLFGLAPWFLLFSAFLGLLLGAQQFWLPFFQKTWAFSLHRSVRRSTVLWSKLAAAVLIFSVGLGVSWTLMYSYATRPGVLPWPFILRDFAEGWIFILLGMVVYFGAALTGLSIARWYTTRIFGLAFAALIFFLPLYIETLTGGILIILLGLLILVAQTIDLFLNREF